MDKHKCMRMAYRIRNQNNEIEAPVNDIVDCIQRMKSTGISGEELESVVENVVLSSSSTTYPNLSRRPNESEILLYSLPDHLADTFMNPR